MSDKLLQEIKELLAKCSPVERKALFDELRTGHKIHQLEDTFGAPAEVILEAIHRAPELTRRMLRGVIADAAFAQFVIPALQSKGWKDVTPPGNHLFDHQLMEVSSGNTVTIQVKLQRSAKGKPVITSGKNYGLMADMFMVEPQKTRSGKTKGGGKTRPYHFGDFNILAVSLQPSSGNWNSFLYTVSDWLLPGKGHNEIGTYQPVAKTTNSDWTDDFEVAATRYHSHLSKKIAGIAPPKPPKKPPTPRKKRS